ncbi:MULTISPECIES: M15 family metallopeptidase [Gammaproteobacteria]|uniref:M15 family metallopeptidase n=1 Tax=Gammaproteobacteria TaxID=1236 RepID=UPI000DD06EA3|nr:MULTISPECIES: M15 family metallopeptidase [Gammaproteobacteria]RTE87041.1 D-alanyl-D-alanine carboxypeptidase family protein [Aliidiomarina sp. B3213]TCZ93169.1 D-alanyl-D-alanine carboxypeptidase family protein [Lysobacter sp. N42]
MTNGLLYGLIENGLVPVNATQRLQEEAATAFTCMQKAAADDGIQLEIASGFRDFNRQLMIWNRKFESESLHHLTPDQRVREIMRWSALPGTSRHHWGTDCDLYDPIALGSNKLQLEPWEYESDGPFNKLTNWLNQHARRFGFYRPYRNDNGGVAPEPWHWSYAPLAKQFLKQYSADELREIITASNLQGKAVVLPQIERIVSQYVHSVDPMEKD